MTWVIAAALAAVFAGITSILAKLGVRSTDSDVATALRTSVVLVLAWGVAALGGNLGQLLELSGETWLFLVLSGLATGGSWICYFKALSLGDANKVVPIDKSSAVLASLMAIVLFAEIDHLAVKLVCIALILAGTLMMIERKDVSAGGRSDGGWLAGMRPGGGWLAGMRSDGGWLGGTRSDGSWLAGMRSDGGWLVYAVLAAVFAALTSILGKVGIDGVDSSLGTAIRTTVVLVVAWALVVARGKMPLVREVRGPEGGFLVASGLATGASWLFYYYALQTGVVSVVVQIDKMSLLVSVLFAGLVLKERLTPRAAVGLGLVTVFTLVMAVFA